MPTDKLTNRPTNRRTDGPTHRRTDAQTEEQETSGLTRTDRLTDVIMSGIAVRAVMVFRIRFYRRVTLVAPSPPLRAMPL